MPRIPKSITLPSKMFNQPKGVLRNLFAEARILLDIQAAVKEVVSAEVQVASLNQGELHLIASSAAVATRIKYSQKTLIGALKANRLSEPVNKIKVSVRPKHEAAQEISRPAIAPNPENAHRLRLAAEHIDDTNLRQALIKLSRREI